ncbi:TolC family protein [Cardiobacterium hominis]|uniref:TolC family protein n=1 Tax=Cardiobacterium hominis TaxID=2718 RepID=UPI00248F74B9|nr:TolC family protein [Cardiobacterium hominis]
MYKRQALVSQQLATLHELARYAAGRFNAGHATAHDTTAIAAQIQALQARQSTLQAQFDAQQRSIAVLIGQTPQSFRLDSDAMRQAALLQHLPSPPQGIQPGSLLNQRPDLRARAAEIQARSAQLASAKADLYPRLTLNFLGNGILNIDSDNTQKSLISLLGASLQVPLYTNGRIQANIDAADARLKTALLQYDQTLLQALADVDNAYQANGALATQTRLLAQARDEAEKQATDAEKLYRYGNKTLADTLSALLSANQAAENQLRSQLAQAQTLIALYKALGGGWAEK